MDGYFAFAAFVLGICLAVSVYFIIAQRLLIERQDEEIKRLRRLIRPFDADDDGVPGGRKRHDPYVER